MKYAKELKALALDDDGKIFQQFCGAERAANKGDIQPLDEFHETYGYTMMRACGALRRSRRMKKKRCKSKVAHFVESGKGWFLTLTFSNEALARTTELTRRRQVARLLKKVSTCYVANIDYGDKKKNPDSNEREHYHAIVECDEKPNLDWWIRNMGFVKIKPIRPTETDIKKVATYEAKLSHHALKKSCESGGKCPRLIYSRNALK